MDLEEGSQMPIKINIPLTALTAQRDEFCCNRLLTVLRVCVLLALLAITGWAATSFYTKYYAGPIPVDDSSSLGNAFTFQSLVYQKNDEVEPKIQIEKSQPEDDEFKESTKKALGMIAAQMEGLNAKLDQIKTEKEQQIQTISEDLETVASERFDPTLDSILDELAEKVGLADNQKTDDVFVEYKPELDAIIVTEPLDQSSVDTREDFAKEIGQDFMTLLEQLGIEEKQTENVETSQEESGFLTQLIGDSGRQPVVIENMYWAETSNEDAQLDAIIKNSAIGSEIIEKQVQEDYFRMWDEFLGKSVDVGHLDESHEEDKQVDQVIQALMDRIATSNVEDDNVSEQQQETEDKPDEESKQEGDLGEEIIRALFTDPLEILFGDSVSETGEELEMENNEESHSEDKVEQQVMEEISEDITEDIFSEFIGEAIGEFLAHEIMENEAKMANDDETTFVDQFEEEAFNQAVELMTMSENSEETVSDGNQESKIHTEESENLENIDGKLLAEEESSSDKSLFEMVPSVEYVKKLELNPYIPRIAKMLEPIVGQNHELLVWYYSHKDLPDFLRGADKWKVFGAKLLYDSNIKDYPADATIIFGLTFEKVWDGAEYPSSAEQIQSNLQQEIVNRLILKSYLNKMLLEGNAEAETLSQVIEQHNEEKLEELEIDPQQLTSTGDFFKINTNDHLIIPVVQFDPFVDDTEEANEARIHVLEAFAKTRSYDEIAEPSYDKDKDSVFDSISYKTPEEVHETSEELTTTPIFEMVEKNSESSETLENRSGQETSYFVAGNSEEDISSTTESQEVDMNEYLFSYDDSYSW